MARSVLFTKKSESYAPAFSKSYGALATAIPERRRRRPTEREPENPSLPPAGAPV